VTLTAQQPLNNVVRVTMQALSAVLGGTQSLHTNAYDEALALPTEESVRLALRTQQVLATESGVTETIDPLGGSWFVESLTTRLENAALELIGRSTNSAAPPVPSRSSRKRSMRRHTRTSGPSRPTRSGWSV
jgi:methylmalonyl-CoA mutase, N-terminal domain